VTRTIIFDLGQVIVPFDFQRGYAAIAAECVHPPEEIRRRLRETGLVLPFEEGKVAPGEFVRRVTEALDLQVSYERFCEMWSSIFLPETLIPEAMVASLHDRYRLLLLSNTNVIHFMRHFDHCVLSYEVGAMKPAPEIYREAVAKAGCSPGEIFFTDDIAMNVEAAREHGIDAVQFQSLPQLEDDMRSRGIVW
jgi:putative hydrolase of the HAD superfamily